MSGKCQACGGRGQTTAASMRLFVDEEPTPLNDEQEKLKREIYEQMNPRRRKFVDRLGYENWDPFQAPKDPLDIRTDRTRRTLQELLRDFMRDCGGASHDPDWQRGARECALGIIQKDEKYQGIFDFCLWYHSILQKEGHSS